MCGWIYDEAKGIPEEGIEPGTPGMKFQMIGFVQFVVLEKRISPWFKYRYFFTSIFSFCFKKG